MTEAILKAAAGALMAAELESQPDIWQTAIAQARQENQQDQRLLPAHGDRVAVIGCGTSWFMAQSYAAAREQAGLGVTDAFTATELPVNRDYDAVLAITRSGTTTEILDILRRLQGTIPTALIVGDTHALASGLADNVIGLPYADERSVVQTRFATAALGYLLTDIGMDLAPAVRDAHAVLSEPLDSSLLTAEQFSFLGQGWTIGLAHEAALKMREAVQGWTESYPAMEYRHGPISIAAPGRITWMLGEAPEGLRQDVEAAGASFIAAPTHPLAELVRVHRLALARSLNRGLDPDHPRNLSRSVILDS
ncbi:sugar isomerase [Acaricomes phytoseiuli]|uniref:SIS domain-containing protein n=1 Tax=Acaricomes phytoseiuli TaxID=291968 RepID=UPI002222DD28|nr:sugar isomerase [Acaricomes phytoseiuli]MCW1250072.1 sugar isomerase [Acaricomes phytoseiuli]